MATDVYEFDKTAIANYASFGAWISAMGVANKSIIIATDTEITGTVTVPINIDIAGFYNGAKFTGTGTLTINKMSCDPQHQIFDTTLTSAIVAKEYIRPEWYGAKPDGSDSTTALQAALASASYQMQEIIFNIGTYLTNLPLDCQARATLKGNDPALTTIKCGASFVGAAVIIAPRRIDGIGINGDNVITITKNGTPTTYNVNGANATSVIGIYAYRDATTYRSIYGAGMGFYMITNCAVAGLKLIAITGIPGNSGMYYSNLGVARISYCGIGIHLISETELNRINGNNFDSVFILSCQTGIEIDGSDNNTWSMATVESCNIGINMLDGFDNVFLAGRFEGNYIHAHIADNPDVIKFDILKMSTDNIGIIEYTYSNNRSVNLPSDNYFKHYGRQLFERLEFMATERSIYGAPYHFGERVGSKTVTSGATIDVKNVNHIYLSYSISTEITDFTNSDALQGWEKIYVFASTTSAYINNGGNFVLQDHWLPKVGDYITLINIPLGGGVYNWYEVNRSTGVAINPTFYGFCLGGGNFDSNDATLDIGWSKGIYQAVYLEYTVPTSILDFTDVLLKAGEIILVRASNSNGYLVNSGNFILNGDWRPSAEDTILLYRASYGGGVYKWIELSRGGAGKSPVRLPSYTVTTLPTASDYTGCQIYVSNETGGAVPAFSDGTNWRRVTDRAIVA